MEQLDKNLEKENINKHIAIVLYNLSLQIRTVFKLTTKYQFTLDEIAVMRKQSLEEMRQLFEKTRKVIDSSFFNKYSIDK